ncbi:MAG: carboxypeptidase regulatory-like domain-containing protein [Terriglobales bacterium]
MKLVPVLPTFSRRGHLAAAVLLLAAASCAFAQAPVSCDIAGKAAAGAVPLPGVTISASNSLTGKKAATSTGVDGAYYLVAPSNGRYVIRAELAGFAVATKEVIVNAATCHPRADLEMMLQSRAQVEEQRQQQTQQQGAGLAGRGFQNLALATDPTGMASMGQGEVGGNGGGATDMTGIPSQALNPDAATESVAIASSNNAAQTNDMMFGGNDEQMRERIQEFRDRAARGEGGNMGGGGMGGPGGGPGGFGGPGGGGGQIIRIGGRRGFNLNKPHGSLFYSASDGVFDAKPYSLNGQPTTQPSYLQQRFGATLGGPLKIPHIYNGGTKTFFFLNYSGNRSDNPYDVFSTVPTLAERAGNFLGVTTRNGAPVQIFDPVTHLPLANNQISTIDPAAQALLNFIPLPNEPGSFQNFHYVTSTENNSDNLNLRIIHNFGAASNTPFPMGGGGGGGGGRGGRGPRNNVNFGIHWQRSDAVQNNPLPTIAGRSKSSALDVPAGWVYGKGHLTNNLRFDFNRRNFSTNNLYSGVENIAKEAGILGVSQNPFDWGVPGLSFTNFVGVNDITPLARHDSTWSLSDTVIWNHGKHNIRWGGDFRRIHQNPQTDKNARGSFVFTGLYTAQYVNGVAVPGTGFDFADFLLGTPQQASVQFGVNDYHFAANSWDLFIQDDWRVRGNLTINVGLRYEYVSPFTEQNHQLANLDAAPGFVAVAPVCAATIGACSSVGPYSGAFPATLVNPDRNNLAPRIGIAWKPMTRTVVRAGYGINYNTTQYSAIVQNLSFQPPFDFTQTNIGTTVSPLLLQNAFTGVSPATTTNNYGVDRNYRLGYVQIWNLDVQRELTRTLVLNLDYNGSKGTHLDLFRAPNRTPSGGLSIAGVQPFLWESSNADSIMHGGTVRLRKRMSHGLSVGGSYTYSKSIDNASSIGGGAVVVAQNDQDLAAERGLSSFDQRHRLTADYVYEFPWGTNKRWLSTTTLASRIFGDWQWSGNIAFATGLPFTARVLGSFTDVASGVNGTLRANVTGQPVSLSDPTVAAWFNTAAFVIPPAGTFGDAGRNTIEGPHTFSVNMAMAKTFSMGDTKGFEVRLQATNVFNNPQFTSIDTVVNSPTFGRVVGVGGMRKLQFLARYRF